MRKISGIEEFKRISLDILRYIKKVCEENNIEYFLAYGTCIGAVRHNGFIPWDDDIDICMTRDNFDRFRRIFRYSSSKYELLYVETPGYSLPLPKVIDCDTILKQVKQEETVELGVFVDVFILDDVPTNPAIQNVWFKKLQQLQKCWRYAQYRKEYSLCSKDHAITRTIRSIFYHYCKWRGARYFAVKIDKLSKKYHGQKTDYVGVMHFTIKKRAQETYPKRYFQSSIKVLFEGELFPIPKHYHDYLSFRYGDYMEIPPENQRCAHHEYSIWIKD